MKAPSTRHPGLRIADLPPTPISRGRYGVSPKRQSLLAAFMREAGWAILLAVAGVAFLLWLVIPAVAS